MTGASQRLLLPIVARHLVREFLWVFALTLTALIAIYLIADFFDRLGSLIKHDAALGAIARLFLFRVPLVVTQSTPFAVLVGALMGLGLLARQNEFVALRACGVSIWQIATPLLAVGALISLAVFAWNESVVPYSARQWLMIRELEIKQRGTVTAFTGRDVWYHGRAGFYNIDRVAPRRMALYGLTVYQLGADFKPRRLIEAESATWNGRGWLFAGARTREFGPDGVRESAQMPRGFTLPETMEDFSDVSVEPEELSYGTLRRQIKELRRKGVDASESWVDLHLKLALPAASFLMMLVAVPLSASGTRVSSLTASIGRGVAVGFGYFVVVAFARALGQSGALPPVLAAWSANVLFALVGGYYLLGAD
jgi:lipopolysaccharide export system permease protein